MKAKLVSLMLAFVMIFSGTISFGQYFSDVDYSDPISEGITGVKDFDYAHGTSIINGFPDGTFRPYDLLTREQVAKMFVEYIGYSPNNYNPAYYQYFYDMDTSRWSYDHVLRLSSLDIINGYPDYTFGPDKYITRAEFTKMLNHLQIHFFDNWHWYSGLYYNSDIYYGDIDYHWAADHIITMSAVYDVDYYSYTNMFYPDVPINRQEAAYMLYRTIVSNEHIFGIVPNN